MPNAPNELKGPAFEQKYQRTYLLYKLGEGRKDSIGEQTCLSGPGLLASCCRRWPWEGSGAVDVVFYLLSEPLGVDVELPS